MLWSDLEYISTFEVDIRHRAGKNNVVPDAISRMSGVADATDMKNEPSRNLRVSSNQTPASEPRARKTTLSPPALETPNSSQMPTLTVPTSNIQPQDARGKEALGGTRGFRTMVRLPLFLPYNRLS